MSSSVMIGLLRKWMMTPSVDCSDDTEPARVAAAASADFLSAKMRRAATPTD